MSGLRLVDDQTPHPADIDHRAQLQAAIVALRKATTNPLLCPSERELLGGSADLLETTLELTKDEVA